MMAEYHQNDDWDPVAGLDVQKVLNSEEDELQRVVDSQIQHVKISLIGPTAGQVLGVINRLEATASILNRKQTDYAERLANIVLEEAARARDRLEASFDRDAWEQSDRMRLKVSEHKNRTIRMDRMQTVIEDVAERWLGPDEPSEEEIDTLVEILDLLELVEQKHAYLTRGDLCA